MTAKKDLPSWSFNKEFNFPDEGKIETRSPLTIVKETVDVNIYEKVYQFEGKEKLSSIQALIEKQENLILKKFAVLSNDYHSFVVKLSCQSVEMINYLDREIKDIISAKIKTEQENIFGGKGDDFLSSLDYHLKVKESDVKKSTSKKKIENTSNEEESDDLQNEYFFKIRNHQDFYKVGNSYYEDFKFGIKSFSFYGVKQNKSVHDTVIGVAAFINYYEKNSALIISNTMKHEELIAEGWTEVEREFSTNTIKKFKIHFLQIGKMYVMNYDELVMLRNKLSGTAFQAFLEEFSELFNLVVWDLPSLDEMSKHNEFYFPLCISIESVSLILKMEENKSREIEKAISFFQKYGVKIKGFLIDQNKQN